MKNAQQRCNSEDNDGGNSGRIGGYFHSAPFVLRRSEFFVGLAFAFGIGVIIGGLISAICFH